MNICVCVYVRTGVPLYVHIYVYAYWCMVMNVIRLLVRECVCTSLLKVFVQFALLTFRSSPASLFNISLMHSCNAQLIKGNFSPPHQQILTTTTTTTPPLLRASDGKDFQTMNFFSLHLLNSRSHLTLATLMLVITLKHFC